MSDGIDPELPDGEEPEDKVGYRKPPREHQFKPGQSGNPRGRPKGAKGLKTELASVINELVTVTVNGKSKKMPTLRVVLKTLAAKAAKGSVPAADKLLALVINAFGFEDERTEAKELSDTDKLILAQFLSFTEQVEPDALPAECRRSARGRC